MLNTAIKAVFLSESVMMCLCRLSGDSIAKIPYYWGGSGRNRVCSLGEDVLVTRDLGLMASAWCGVPMTQDLEEFFFRRGSVYREPKEKRSK